MSNFSTRNREYGTYLEAMNEAFRRGDESAFFAAVDRIVHLREPEMLTEIRKLTGDLQKALDRFSIESRLADIAENEIPNARTRLTHVINMTDEAAHRTLDLVERSGPLAERTAREADALVEALDTFRDRPVEIAGFEGIARSVEAFLPVVRAVEAFLPSARADCEQIRRNLADVLLAQGYQDLTGQIIRSVIKLVEELEHTLSGLTKLSGGTTNQTTVAETSSTGYGPVVPGVTKGEVASAQTDVDALLSGLGM